MSPPSLNSILACLFVKWWSLRCSLGQSNAGLCAVILYVGEGPRASNGTCSTACQISVTPSATHNQIGPFCCCFPSESVFVCSRALWVSPPYSPVRLGVSPAAASTPTGVFNQRFEALFPLCWSPGLCGLLCSHAIPPGLSMCECGAAGSASPPPCGVC